MIITEDKKIKRAESALSVGIDTVQVQAMIDQMLEERLNLHSLMIIRHNQVACEAWRKPLSDKDPHMAYSVSKSFLSTAFGFALHEGYVTKETKFLDVFPEYRPKKKDPYLEKLTIFQLIAMRSGKRAPITNNRGSDWIKCFVNCKWDFEPDTDWRYVSENYFAASAALVRLTGQSINEFLTPRLFEPLEIDPPVWEKSPDGIEAGGWGMFLRTEDMAKLILCYHNGGRWNDKQVIPEEWVREAVKKQSDNSNSQSKRDSQAGYGYGFWRCAAAPGMENTYRCEGMYSQYAISFEDYDACLVMTGSYSKLQRALDLVWEYMAKAFVPEQEGAADKIKIKIPDSPAPIVAERSFLEKKISGHTYKMKRNRFLNSIGMPTGILPLSVCNYLYDKGGNMDNIRFDFSRDGCIMSWTENETNYYKMDIGMNGCRKKNTLRVCGIDFDAYANAYWKNKYTFVVFCRPIAGVAERTLTFTFSGDKITMSPNVIPTMEENAREVGDTLKCVLKGKYYHTWIDILVPKVSFFVLPDHKGKLKT
ncbi:MAG: serine hydrolase [Clostridiales bacterium]|nr:serine hydrolase [Clostridiales bacterium]